MKIKLHSKLPEMYKIFHVDKLLNTDLSSATAEHECREQAQIKAKGQVWLYNHVWLFIH